MCLCYSAAMRLLALRSFSVATVLLITGLILSAFYLFVPIRFVENDDIVMLLLASGRYTGEPSSNLVFINEHLGRLLSAAYTALPTIEWYVLFQLLILSVAFAVPLSILIEKAVAGERTGFVFFALLAIAIVVSMIGMQFTTSAAIAASIGVYSILVGPGRNYPVIGTLLIFASVLLRFEAAALAVFVVVPFVVIAVISGLTGIARVLILVGVLAISMVFHTTGEHSFSTKYPEYARYIFLGRRIAENPNANLSSDELPSGISENDYSLFLSFFPDATQIDTNVLGKINQTVEERVRHIAASNWFRSAVDLIDTSDAKRLVALLILLAIGSRTLPIALLTLAGAASFFLPLLFVEMTATLKARVLFSAQFPVIASLFFLNVWHVGKILTVLVALIVAGLAHDFYGTAKWGLIRHAQERSLFQAQSELIQGFSGAVYAYRADFMIEGARMLTKDIDTIDPSVIFLGWMVNHPDNDRYRGYLDFLRKDAAIYFRGGDAYLDQTEKIRQSFFENYGKTVRYRVILAEEAGVLVQFLED